MTVEKRIKKKFIPVCCGKCVHEIGDVLGKPFCKIIKGYEGKNVFINENLEKKGEGV